MYTQTWVLAALLAVAAVTGRPAEEGAAQAGLKSSVPFTPHAFDYVIQDAVVTELNHGKAIVLPNLESTSEPKSDKMRTTTAEPPETAKQSETGTKNSEEETEAIPYGRSVQSPRIEDMVNKQNPVIEYLNSNLPMGNTPKQEINSEKITPVLRRINYHQSIVAPQYLGQQSQGYYPTYYQPQYPAAYYSPSNELRSEVPSGIVAGPNSYGRQSWSLSNYFPIVIHNPLPLMFQTMSQLVDYGPQSDVCVPNKNVDDNAIRNSRMGKAMLVVSDDGKGGLKLSGDTRLEVIEDRVSADTEPGRSISSKKNESEAEEEKDQNTEIVMESSPQGEGKGPFITRLLVRRGGVAIAGPGGIATAGSGGTAIVGPGGVAYARPNGLAVVGPGGKVVSLPSGVTEPRSGAELPPGARVVALGPTVYFHPAE